MGSVAPGGPAIAEHPTILPTPILKAAQRDLTDGPVVAQPDGRRRSRFSVDRIIDVALHA
ncbi:MAG: hypothetical protein ACLQJR_09070 [Stellaceae bacterium]